MIYYPFENRVFRSEAGELKKWTEEERGEETIARKDPVQNSDTFSIPSETSRDMPDFKSEENSAKKKQLKRIWT